MMYVTLQQAKSHLYVIEDHDDTLISGYIKSASKAVKNYLKSASPFEVERDIHGNPIQDSNGDPIYVIDTNSLFLVAPEVQQATLLLVGYFYKDRDEDSDKDYDMGYLPKPVMALLYPLRDPAYA